MAEVAVGRVLREDAPRVVLGAQPQHAGHVRVAESGQGRHRRGEVIPAESGAVMIEASYCIKLSHSYQFGTRSGGFWTNDGVVVVNVRFFTNP